MTKVMKYVLIGMLRSHLVLLYALVCAAISFGLEYMNAAHEQTMVSLLHVLLLMVPLVTILLGTIHYYQSREFIELLVAQPITRKAVFMGHYCGFTGSLLLAIGMGLFLPVFILAGPGDALLIFLPAAFLTLVFSAFAFFSSVGSPDKSKGIGKSLLIWFVLTVLYDGLVMAVLFLFNDYPLDHAVLAMTALNPVDLARIMVMIKLDASALMGFTGAVFSRFFGAEVGFLVACSLLLIWMVLPLLMALRKFTRQDL